ncbi:MAG: hypothetical protein DRR04_14420 [Gammaproteobacteria bacterium]|nr:MAG: hypothetical protein DRQ97_11995 [Gammaproteobacteria bacterium]RLA55912.1 MAG: hypothetical protein DRR04_14420 [Gammaproteobacteria bacterium]
MAKTAAQRKAQAKKKVTELVKKGRRLREGAGSDHYKDAIRQKKMGSYFTGGTGHTAAKTVKKANKGTRRKK